jgi:transposase
MPQQLDDLSRSLTALEQDSTIMAVIEMSQASWLVAGMVPGIERHPLKKLEPSEVELLRLLMRWRAEATQKGRTITRIAVAFEAGRDGFWLARWLRARDIEAYVIHPTSVAVSREHRRAKTDRLDTGLLKRVFLGWLRGEPDHCHMVAIPTLAEEDAKRPNREREGLVRERTRLVNRMKGGWPASGFGPSSRRCATPRTVSQRCGPPRGAAPAQHAARTASRHGPTTACHGPDQGSRASPCARAETGPSRQAACHGSSSCPHPGHWP